MKKILSLLLITMLIIGNSLPVFADSINNYTKLEYIQSTGDQYISIPYQANFNTSVYIEGTGWTDATSYGAICGTRNNGFNLWIMMANQSKVRFAYGGNNVDTVASAQLTNDFIIETNKNQINITIGGYTSTYSVAQQSSGSATGDFYIFKYNNGYQGHLKLKRFKILENTNVLYDLIPVKRNSDSVLGMYDQINDVFYMNAGSGSFTEGPAIPIYSITLGVTPAGSGTVTGGGQYYENDTTTITATPSSGYEFVEWSDGSTINPRTITVTSNVNLVATFRSIAPVTYTVSLSVSPSGAGTVSGGGSYSSGSTATITATANEGYVFNSWSDGNTANPRSITVSQNINLSANFVVIPSDGILISTSVNPYGSGYVTGGGYYEENDEATLEAIPNTGYEFVDWSDGETDNPRTITVTDEATYIANFQSTTPVTPVDNDTLTLIALLISFLILVMMLKGGLYD